MHINLSGKTAIITASTAGIGLATAKGLAVAGASVIVTGRTREGVDRAVKAVGAVGQRRQGGRLCRGPRGCTRLRRSGRGAPDLRYPRQQPRNLRRTGLFRDSPQRMAPFFRGECHVRRALVARLSAGDDRPRMGPRRLRLLGVGAEHSRRHGPLRLHQDGATFHRTRACQARRRHRRDGQFRAARADAFGGSGKDAQGYEGDWTIAEDAGAAFVKANRPSSIIQRAASVGEVANMIVYVCSPQASATTGAALRVDGGVVDTIA